MVERLRRHNHLNQVSLVVYTVMDLDDSDRDRLKLGRTEILSKGNAGPEEVGQRVVDLLSQVVPKPSEIGARREIHSHSER